MEKASEKSKGWEEAVEEFVEIALHFSDLKEERCSWLICVQVAAFSKINICQAMLKGQ